MNNRIFQYCLYQANSKETPAKFYILKTKSNSKVKRHKTIISYRIINPTEIWAFLLQGDFAFVA